MVIHNNDFCYDSFRDLHISILFILHPFTNILNTRAGVALKHTEVLSNTGLNANASSGPEFSILSFPALPLLYTQEPAPHTRKPKEWNTSFARNDRTST